MRRSMVAKFPSSVQLFKFCQKVLADQKQSKIHDQEVGSILNFNPSDCSHWKRGEKSIRSVFSLAKLAETLQVEISLIHDLAEGSIGLDEAYFEYTKMKLFKDTLLKASDISKDVVSRVRAHIDSFVSDLHKKADFTTPPLYLPEIFRFFPFVTTQPIDMMDRLSRVLRSRPGQYMVQFKKGDLKPQTRMSIALDLAQIVLEGERKRYEVFGPVIPEIAEYEQFLFAAALLVPKNVIKTELTKIDSRKNLVAELASLFWVPKSLVCFQMQDLIRRDKTPLAQKVLQEGVNTITN